MPLYESVFIARQDVSTPQVEALADEFASVIEQNGGKVTKREAWGLKGLAYKIKKNRKGHYMLFNLDAPSEAIAEMERQMRIHEDILRYLTVRVDELEEGPSIVMRSRHSDERPRRRGEGGGSRGSYDRSDGNGGGRNDRDDKKPEAAAKTEEAGADA